MTQKLFVLTVLLILLADTIVACMPVMEQAKAAPETETAVSQPQQMPQPPINNQLPNEAESTTVDTETYLPIVTNELADPANDNIEDYNLFTALNSTTTYLIDSEGNAIHTWESSYRPGNAVYLLEDGSLLRTGTTNSQNFDTGGAGGIVQILDIDSNVTWEYSYNSSEFRLHHDVEMLPNDNILMIAWELKSEAEAIAAGRDPSLLSDGELWPDHIIEVNPAGNIVWAWYVWDHLIQDFDATKANYGVVADQPELIDINFTQTGRQAGGADWNHINSIDYNAELDQILLSVHNTSEIWIIDHSTTTAEAASHSGGNSGKGGDLLYRWGNPQAYDAGSTHDQQFFAQHDATWIEDGYPGAGNILIFNNGTGRGYSSVDEIIPPVNADGSYTLVTGSAYSPTSATWTYVAENPTDFYAERISGAQRLQDGNTLICEGTNGRFFEVTPDGEIGWEYQVSNAHVFRVTRYTSDYPGIPQ